MKKIERWYEEAKAYAKPYNLSLLDLFYWEQRIGNWGALYPFEQDIAIEEFSPFNNKDLILSILQVDKHKRCASSYIFSRRLIEELWPETLCQPLNPIIDFKSGLKMFIRRSDRLYFRNKLRKCSEKFSVK